MVSDDEEDVRMGKDPKPILVDKANGEKDKSGCGV